MDMSIQAATLPTSVSLSVLGKAMDAQTQVAENLIQDLTATVSYVRPGGMDIRV